MTTLIARRGDDDDGDDDEGIIEMRGRAIPRISLTILLLILLLHPLFSSHQPHKNIGQPFHMQGAVKEPYLLAKCRGWDDV